ncbi:MAG: hypothetical protein Kow0042_04050 [Calditrichia bacterium]
MQKSFVSFMRHLIDYAGLFPPAKLSMEEAVKNYCRYMKGADSWMLGRFICPLARLAEFCSVAERCWKGDSPIKLSVLPRYVQNPTDLLKMLQSDLKNASSIMEQYPGLFVVEFLEMRLPGTIPDKSLPDFLANFYNMLIQFVRDHSLPAIRPFFEWDALPENRPDYGRLAEIIAAQNRELASPALFPAGLKLRCGGETPTAIPDVPIVAQAIQEVYRHRLPFKATAGLHHAVSHFNDSLPKKMLGFLNLFGALLLFWADRIAPDKLALLLEDENPQNFQFNDEFFIWRNFQINREEITRLRGNYVVSFGSCDFDEPREDLREMNLLV